MHRPDVVDVLRHVGGAASARDLAAVCGRTAIARAVTAGVVLRVARRRYALPHLADPWTSAIRLGGVVSHTSAAQQLGLAVLGHADIAHVTVARTRSRLPRGQVRTHWADLSPGELHPDRPMTGPLRTVLDCARTLPLGQALAVADSALRAGLVGGLELSRAAQALQGPGSARARRVAGAADDRAESALESALRAVFLEARLTGFVPQLLIKDGGFQARVDLADETCRVVAEADSFEHHGYRAALVRDCERYDELVARRWRVLRFAWEQVLFRPDWVAAVARQVVIGPAPRPTDMQRAA